MLQTMNIMTKKEPIGLGEILFTKTQRKVLGLLFGKPFRRYYGNEIIKLAGVGTGSVRSFLYNLVTSGLVIETKEGNQKYYQANHQSPIFQELRGIVIKTFGIAEVVKEVLLPIKNEIQFSFIFGSIANGTDHANSDLDILLITENLDYLKCMKLLMPLSKELNRDIDPSVYTSDEFIRKVKSGNHFFEQMLNQPKIMIIGTENEFEEFRKDRTVKI
jgi:predicted nucleotidyltransferase